MPKINAALMGKMKKQRGEAMSQAVYGSAIRQGMVAEPLFNLVNNNTGKTVLSDAPMLDCLARINGGSNVNVYQMYKMVPAS